MTHIQSLKKISVLPDGALHELPVSEDPVVLRKVKYGRTQHCKVEYLMTSSAEVELAGSTTLGAANHVDDRALDVDIPA